MRPDRPTLRMLDKTRLHARHGPIDLIISADGVDVADVVSRMFPDILPGLVAELSDLRRPIFSGFAGPVAQRMAQATRPFAPAFITPMAAVAGSVADFVLDALLNAGARRAWVNNGGDIAVHLPDQAEFRVGLFNAPETDARAGTISIDSSHRIGGIATSGWQGRSHSLGIADAVTVLAHSAAAADAAATMIANATTIDDPAIERRPASELSPDSDLGQRCVTTHVPNLSDARKIEALASGKAFATQVLDRGLIRAVYLDVQGKYAVVSAPDAAFALEPAR